MGEQIPDLTDDLEVGVRCARDHSEGIAESDLGPEGPQGPLNSKERVNDVLCFDIVNPHSCAEKHFEAFIEHGGGNQNAPAIGFLLEGSKEVFSSRDEFIICTR